MLLPWLKSTSGNGCTLDRIFSNGFISRYLLLTLQSLSRSELLGDIIAGCFYERICFSSCPRARACGARFRERDSVADALRWAQRRVDIGNAQVSGQRE